MLLIRCRHAAFDIYATFRLPLPIYATRHIRCLCRHVAADAALSLLCWRLLHCARMRALRCRYDAAMLPSFCRL